MQMERWWLTICLGAVAVLAAPTLDEEHSLATEFVTPHTAWAKPYALGSTRVLFFSDYRNASARQIIELGQRFELTAEAAYYSRIVDTSNVQWHGGEAGLSRIRSLLEQSWDVFWFNNVPLDKLPAELQYKLLRQVADGAGLVMIGVKDKRVLKRPSEATAVVPGAEVYSLRSGRAVWLPPERTVPYRFGWETEYDWNLAELGRALLWAADKLPESRPLHLRQPAAAPDQLILPGSAARLKLSYRLRRSDGRVFGEGPLEPAGGQVLRLPRPHLPAGDYRYELQARDGKDVVDWELLPLTVQSPRQVAVELDQGWGEIGETIAGRLNLTGPAQPGEQVRAELVDRQGRVLAATGALPVTEETAPFAFEILPHYPMLVQVRARLTGTAGELADATAYAKVVKRHRDRFNFLVWDIPNGPAAPLAEAALADLGMTLQLGTTPQPQDYISAFNVAYVPYTTRIMDDKDAEGHMKPVPWNKEPEVDEYVAKIVEKYRPAREHGAFVYSLGDETVVRGSDLSPSDLAAYRRHLEGAYGSLAALNESWGTDFGAWDEIELLDPKDPRESQAKEAGNFPRWYDRQAWESANFIGLCERFGQAFRQLDPLARTGFEGAGRFDRGDDIQGIVETNGFWAPYPSEVDLVVRDIAPRDFPRANWMGYVKDAEPLIWKYWRMILNGNDSVWYWRWDGIGRFNGLLMPTLQPFPQIAEMMEDTRITREGLVDVLLRSELQNDGIVMVYSPPASYATMVADGPSYGSYVSDHQGWHRALFNLGLNFRYVTSEMLTEGNWGAEQTKVLILARQESLSEAEAAQIRRFVENGGTVIADLRPGLYNGHLKRRPQGALDELFGVDTSGTAQAVTNATVELSLDPQQVGRPRETWRQTGLVTDPGIKPTGAMALGGGPAPALMVNSVGTGQAIYLNLGAVNLAGQGATDPPQARTWLGQLLAQAGVAAPVTLSRAAEATGDIQMIRWLDGPTQIVAVQTQQNAEEETVNLQWAEPRRVFDVKAGKDLGTLKQVTVATRPGRAAILALLPGAEPTVQATLSSDRAMPGETVQLRLTGTPGIGHGAVYLTGIGPAGQAADWLEQVVVLPPGETVSVPIPVALNEAPGVWRLQYREIFSQRTGEVKLTVRGADR